jgi:hypothetical protein
VTTATTPRVYIGRADTAKLLRTALRRAFPDGRFRVRLTSGSSIDVDYTGGPPLADVDAIARDFAGGGFDGSIDLAYYIDAYVDPADYSRVLGHKTPGSYGSGGYARTVDALVPGAVLVTFGTTFVFVHRTVPVDDLAKVRAIFGTDRVPTDTRDAILGTLPFGDPRDGR